jgi:hypothetical protein
MMKALGWAVLLLGSAGCVFEDEHERHRYRPAVVEPGHVHCAGCGHVMRGGVWVEAD